MINFYQTRGKGLWSELGLIFTVEYFIAIKKLAEVKLSRCPGGLEAPEVTPTSDLKAPLKLWCSHSAFADRPERSAVSAGEFLDYKHEIVSGFRGRKSQQKGRILVSFILWFNITNYIYFWDKVNYFEKNQRFLTLGLISLSIPLADSQTSSGKTSKRENESQSGESEDSFTTATGKDHTARTVTLSTLQN